MRRLLLALLCCLPAFGAWNYSAALTYNSTLTGSAPSSNFPALVSATNNSLCLTSNGTHAGYVQSSTGADIEFFADSGLTTQLASEIESYSGSGATCSVVAWVLIGTLSISANGTVYIAVGNASPPSRTSGLWTTAGYSAVYHLANGATLSGTDSTGNGYTGTTGGTAPGAGAGQMDGAMTLGGAGYLSATTMGNFGSSEANGVAVSMWVNMTSNSAIEAPWGTWSSGGDMYLGVRFNDNAANSYAAGNIRFSVQSNTGGSNATVGGVNSNVISTGAWHHVVFEFAQPNTIQIYVDGSPQTIAYSVQTTPTSFSNYSYPMFLGALNEAGTTAQYFTGSEDEVRFKIGSLSSSWVTAEYNNQSSPGNIGSPGFWTWGSWTSIPSLSISGCSTATLGSASASCTVTVANGSFNGTTNTVSLTDAAVAGVGGIFTVTGGSPSSFTGSGTVTPAAGSSVSFTYTPAIVGPRQITVTNNFSAINPSPATMTVTSSTPCTFTMTGSGMQSIAATSGWTSTGSCGHSSPTSGDSLVATASGGTLTITVPNDSVVHTLGTCPSANTTYDLQLTAVAAGSAVFDVQPGAKFYFCGNRLLTSVVTSLSSTPTVWADLKYETGATVYEDEAQASYAHRTTTSATGEWVRLLWGSSGDTCTFGPGAAYSCPTNVQAVNLGAVNPVVYDPGSTSDSHLFKIYGTGVTGGCGSATAGCLNYASYGSSVSPYADAGAIYLGGDVFDTTGTVQAPTSSFEPTTRLQVSGTHFVNDLFGFAYNGNNNGTEGYLGSSLASCNISGNYFSAMVGNGNQTLSACVFSGNVFAEGIYVAWNASSPIPTFSNNVDLVSNANGWGVNFSLTAPVLNNYFGYLDNSSSNHLLGTMTTNDYYRGNVFEALYTGLEESHCTSTSQVGTNTVILLDNLSVMSPNGNNSCQMYGWDQTGSLPVAWVDHNGAFGNAVYSWLIFLSHTTYIATNQVLRSLRANIGWSPSAGGSNFGVIGTQGGTAANVPSNLAYVPNEAYNAWYNPAASATYGAGVDTNCNPSTSLGTPYDQCTASGTPGAHDITANPKLIDVTRGLFQWAYRVKGQAATLAGAEAALLGCQNLGYCINQLRWWVRAGYQPTNLALKGQAHDGAVVGVTGTLGSGYSGTCGASVAVQDTDDLGSGVALACSFSGGVPVVTVVNPGMHYRVATPAAVTITGAGGSGTSLYVLVSPSDIGPVPISLFAGVAP